MSKTQDDFVDRAIGDYFRKELDCGQEFAEIFAPEAEVNVEDKLRTLEARLAERRQSLVKKSFPNNIQGDAKALVATIPPEQLSSDYQALQRAQAGIMRARVEAERILVARLRGDFAQTEIADPLFAGIEPYADGSVPSRAFPSGDSKTPTIKYVPTLGHALINR